MHAENAGGEQFRVLRHPRGPPSKSHLRGGQPPAGIPICMLVMDQKTLILWQYCDGDDVEQPLSHSSTGSLLLRILTKYSPAAGLRSLTDDLGPPSGSTPFEKREGPFCCRSNCHRRDLSTVYASLLRTQHRSCRVQNATNSPGCHGNIQDRVLILPVTSTSHHRRTRSRVRLGAVVGSSKILWKSTIAPGP